MRQGRRLNSLALRQSGKGTVQKRLRNAHLATVADELDCGGRDAGYMVAGATV